MWHCNWGPPFFNHPFVGVLINIMLLVIILSAVVFIFRAFFPKARPNRDASDSMEIVKRKFALGEITEEEYLRMKDILTSG